MNLRQIEVFRAFMLTGTISDAARLFGVSQPAISAMLHHIQDRGGLRLLERAKVRLLPTPEARTLFAETDLAWKSVERVQRLSEDLAAGRSATLRVAATTAWASMSFRQWCGRWQSPVPRCRCGWSCSRRASWWNASWKRKRFLQRIWLHAKLGRELAPAFDHLFGPASTRDGIPQVEERRAA